MSCISVVNNHLHTIMLFSLQATIAVHHSVSSASCIGVSAQMRTISAKGDGLTCLKIKVSLQHIMVKL